MIVGREAEQARIQALLDEARRGRTGTLVVLGEPGIGKTALLDEVCAHGSSLRVLRVTAVEAESPTPFAGLDALLRPLHSFLPRLVAPQRAALEVALAVSGDGGAEPLAVGAGTLTLLAEAAAEQPLLVCIDDAHWLDPPSANAVAFAARRLVAEEIAFLVALRPGKESPFEKGFAQLALPPLRRGDARRVLSLRVEDVPAASVERLLDLAEGNPLALLELPAAVAAPVPDAASSPSGRVSQAFASRLEAMPRPVRMMLALGAVEPDGAAVRRAGSVLGLDGEPTGVLDASRLAWLDVDGIHFRHPLVRSLAYTGLTSEERRDVHRALAEVLTDERDRDRRAWHLGAAATDADDEVAALLEQTAERARRRGGNGAAADALERAAHLSRGEVDRARRMTAAARSAFWAGEPARALRLAEAALACAPDATARADALLEHASIRGAQGVSYDEERFTAAVAGLEGLDPDRLTRLLMSGVTWRMQALDATGAVERADRLERVARSAGGWWGPRGLATAAAAHLAAGDTERFWALFEEVLDDDAVTANMALDLVWAERYAEARHALDASLRDGRTTGNRMRVIWNQACLAHLEVRLGRLAEAELAAAEAIALGEAHGTLLWLAVSRAALAVAQAWQGSEESRVTAAAAAAGARAAGTLIDELAARAGAGLIGTGVGDWEAVVEELTPSEQVWHASSFMEPGAAPFVPDLIEAHARLGDEAEARRALDRFRLAAERAQRRWALAAVARCEGLLAGSDSFDEPFGRALALLEGTPIVLERARAQLAYGGRLRRAGRRRDARIQLRAAHEAFTASGAKPWADRAAAELKATGAKLGPRAPERRAQLTPQELQIAHLVAEGRTNKEIAVQLYLSPKTIEYHLANAYRKLEVHSRAELTRVIS